MQSYEYQIVETEPGSDRVKEILERGGGIEARSREEAKAKVLGRIFLSRRLRSRNHLVVNVTEELGVAPIDL